MQRRTFPTMHAAGWLAALMLLAGCGGPEYHPVHGKVTLDGEPLPDAGVTFRPENEDGQWGIGRTDAQGQYAISMGEQTGLLARKYRVAISTFIESNEQRDPPMPGVPERVPMQYNVHTTLEHEVTPGDNPRNFELSSEGKIYNPEKE